MDIDTNSIAYKILDLARFAPSGDNIQPWKFKILSSHSFEIHMQNCSDWMIYDKLGTASFLALGAMFEYIDIAAAEFACTATFSKIPSTQARLFIYSVEIAEQTCTKGGLFDTLKARSVQRKSMGTDPLSHNERQQLVDSLPNGFKVELYDSPEQKHSLAKLLFGNGFTRYAMEEGYKTHYEAIDWRKGYETFSPTKIPPKALGMNPLMVALTKWSLSSWKKFHFIEKYLGGTLLPRFLMDYRTAIKSSALFIITRDTAPQSDDDYIESGRAMVRFWLMANKLGLGYQPQYTPVLFAEYLRAGITFTTSRRAMKQAHKMNKRFIELVGESVVNRSVYMGRIGRTDKVTSRSTRMAVSDLILP